MRLTEEVTGCSTSQADIWFSGEGDAEGGDPSALRTSATLYGEHGVLLRAIVEARTTRRSPLLARDRSDRFVDATSGASRSARRRAPVAQAAHATAFALCWMIERTSTRSSSSASRSPRRRSSTRLNGICVRAVYGS